MEPKSSADAKTIAEAKPVPAGAATFELFEGVYYDYIRRIGEIWDGLTKGVLEAQGKLAECLTGAPHQHADAQKAFDAAHNDYTAAVRAAWDESQKQYAEAYAQYVRGYREAWEKVQPADMAPLTMAIISQSASMAASYANGTIGNWALISWAGVPPWKP